jgi:hypothetical protein
MCHALGDLWSLKYGERSNSLAATLQLPDHDLGVLGQFIRIPHLVLGFSIIGKLQERIECGTAVLVG